jgi:hypothetical protein
VTARVGAGVALALAGVLIAATAGPGQGRTLTLRIASVAERAVAPYRVAAGAGRPAGVRPELRAALDRDTLDRTLLVRKPARILGAAEAAPLGARGDFDLVALRPGAGGAPWLEIEVAARSGRPDDVLIVEVGGETSPTGQVLDALFLVPPGGGLVELPLAPAALLPGQGVPVLRAPPGPLARSDARARFRGASGLEFLVIRSLVEAMVDAATTARGRADASPHWAAEWREGDRVYIRVSPALPPAPPPAIVLAWKDRVSLGPLVEGR